MSQWLQKAMCLLIILCCTLLSGCWSSIELNDRAFISVLIIDQADDGIEVTLGFPLTDNLIPGESSGQTFSYFSRVGSSLEDAIQKIQGDLSRKITFGQNRSIILGSSFAEQGIDSILEFAARNPFIRLNTNIYLVEGNAKNQVSQSAVITERFFVSVLNGYIRNNLVLSTTIRDLLSSKESGGDGVLPILQFSKHATGSQDDSLPSVGTGGAGIIREGKLIKPYLNPEEAASAKSLSNQLSQYFFSIPSPTDGMLIGFYSTSVVMKTKVIKESDGIHIILKPISETVIISSDSNIDLMEQSNIEQLEAMIEEFSDERLKHTIDIIQKSKADVFHYDRNVSIQFPKEWQEIKDEWRDYFGESLTFDFDSKVTLTRKGTTHRSLKNIYMNKENEE